MKNRIFGTHKKGWLAIPAIFAAFGISLVAVGCDNQDLVIPSQGDDLRTRFNLQTLGAVSYPADNPPRQERIALGRLLFFDPIRPLWRTTGTETVA